MNMSQRGDEFLNDEELQEDACHFQVVDGDGACRVGIRLYLLLDGLGPFQSPDDWMEGMCAR